ncbi:RFXK protein, partial [Cnemophilus loriae]|nr:RFXK protein [Cnemophilus loriae]
GADLTEEADSGYTPMDLAVALGHKKGKYPPPTGHRESHPEAVPEQEEEEEVRRQLQLFPGSPRPHPSLEQALAPCSRHGGIQEFLPSTDPGLSQGGTAAVPRTQGHSFLRAAAFQPWLSSAAPCFPLEINS